MSKHAEHKDGSDLRPILDFAEHARPFVEGSAALVAGIALAGYLALRSHANWLGIPMATSFEFDHYLMTSLSLARDLIFRGLIWFVPSLLVAWVVEKVVRKTFKSRDVAADIQAARVALSLDVVVSLAQLGAIGGFLSWMFRLEAKVGPENIALGLLNKLVAFAALKTDLFYELLIAAVILTVATRPAREPAIARRPRLAVWRSLTFLFLLLLIPQAYGVTSMSTSYRSVRARSKDGSVQCGLLVNNASDTLSIWSAKAHVGLVTTLRREDVVSSELGAAFSILEDPGTADPCSRLEHGE